ncbi:type II CRISPR-associated endonuclease Cas1 [Collinsella sp. AGMB00827]|uniref:CRISPR-associated endonuclease Cas1 n=1 Tax=Collinsella ureilytica TaxID=2869515 RepID=A0ABS7MPC0_9ACTN|nr:type II CRISPR-associated endonuclease Cas1 [Collinsella urealyticum]
MAFRTVFIESPCHLSYRSGYLVVRREDTLAKVHLSEISSIVLQTMQVNISAYLMSELSKGKISLIVSDEKHNPIGQLLPIYGSHNVSKRIVEQQAWGESIKKRVWQRIVREKIRQQAALLSRRELPEAALLLSAMREVRSGDTTNREAHAARIYFKALFGSDFSRDQMSPVNAALNYGYSILLSTVNREIVSRGFLTQCGICHRSEFNQFNLACDFMEPFRPVVDRLVGDWVGNEFGSDERHLLGDMMNNTMEYRDGEYKLGSVISRYIQDCLNALNKQILPDDIAGYTNP